MESYILYYNSFYYKPVYIEAENYADAEKQAIKHLLATQGDIIPEWCLYKQVKKSIHDEARKSKYEK